MIPSKPECALAPGFVPGCRIVSETSEVYLGKVMIVSDLSETSKPYLGKVMIVSDLSETVARNGGVT